GARRRARQGCGAGDLAGGQGAGVVRVRQRGVAKGGEGGVVHADDAGGRDRIGGAVGGGTGGRGVDGRGLRVRGPGVGRGVGGLGAVVSGDRRHGARVVGGPALANRRAAGQQGIGLGGAAVVAQRRQQRVGTADDGSRGQAAAGGVVAHQVI